jgi:aminopeptidase N
MSNFAFETYKKTPTSLLINLTAHEIAHQWWYGAVGNDQVYEPWLDESFAKYSELLFYEHYYPEIVSWWWENHINSFNPVGPINRSIYEFQSTSEYIQQIYSQSARFMHDLRNLMGDTKFFDFAKAYQVYGQSRIMKSEDFFTILKAHTDENLTDIVNQYFTTD